jgi:hypothetical protein
MKTATKFCGWPQGAKILFDSDDPFRQGKNSLDNHIKSAQKLLTKSSFLSGNISFPLEYFNGTR